MIRIITIGLVALLLLNCQEPTNHLNIKPADQLASKTNPLSRKVAQPLRKIYTPTDLGEFRFPFINAEDAYALGHNNILLTNRYDRNFKVGSLEFSSYDLLKTQQILQSWQFTKPVGIEQSLEAHQIKGINGTGDVRFTAYFTPEFEVRAKKTGSFKYPVNVAYRKKPTGNSDNSEDGVLVKLFYTNRENAVSSMRMQGSGYIVFSKTRKVLVKYVSNPDRYISQRTLLASNNSHVNAKPVSFNAARNFFLASASDQPNGACKTALTTFRSIAVDPKFIPLGSILLAEVPYRTPKGDLLYETQLLYAQDTGGGIKGGAHVDLYYGTGELAQKRALDIHHPGKLYLLLPKQGRRPVNP